MEPIVKELYLPSFQNRLELPSSYSRAGGGEKETGTMSSTKEDSSKGGDPKPCQDSPAKRSPARTTPGVGSQR